MKSVGNSVNQDGRPTVFVVDDDASVREAVRSLLRSVGLRVETFGTAQEFLSSPCNSSPGCLVLDVRLPEIGGLELQHQLAQRNLHIPIIFITGHGDIPMSVRAIKAGALEFLTKPFRDQDLLDVVQQAIDQDRRARQQRAEIAELRQRYEGLSPREREVMALVARGLPNKQIAGTLGTSEATVKLHRGRSMQKMQAASLADLIRMAEKLGIPAGQ
jgi:FixJ family two-component response regulator